MAKYQIEDHEINQCVEVSAPGFIEAIAEHLPWPTIEVDITLHPTHGKATVIDKQTGFKYTVSRL